MAPCLLRWGQQTFTAASPGHWEDHESGQVTPAPKLVPESPSADRGMGPPALRPHPHSGCSSLFSGRWQVQILVLSTLQAPGSRMGTWANERKCCSSPISLMPLGLQLILQSASTSPGPWSHSPTLRPSGPLSSPTCWPSGRGHAPAAPLCLAHSRCGETTLSVWIH